MYGHCCKFDTVSIKKEANIPDDFVMFLMWISPRCNILMVFSSEPSADLNHLRVHPHLVKNQCLNIYQYAKHSFATRVRAPYYTRKNLSFN